MKNALAHLERTHPLLLLCLCFASGSVSALSMAPLNAWPLLFIGLSILYICLDKSRNTRQAFFCGWFFGFGYFLFGLSWVGHALLVDGNPYKWAWPLAICGLPFILAPFPAIASALAHRFTNLRKISGYVGFVTLLSLFEYLRGHLFTGFPWNLFGYTWSDYLPVIQIVSIHSIYLLTLITILWASLAGFICISQGSRKQKILLTCIVIASFILSTGYGVWRIQTHENTMHEGIAIHIVSPSIPQEDKWDQAKLQENFFEYIRASYPAPDEHIENRKATYIVWPETALYEWVLSDPAAFNVLRQTLKSYMSPAYFMTGILRTDTEHKGYYNSLIMIDRNGTVSNIYDKHHLVPFGEYIPFQKHIPLLPINRFSGFIAGESLVSHATPEGILYSPLICYESIFPKAAIQNQAPQVPDMLVNVTNDGWYAGSAGPEQHFVHARFRAIEEGIPLIRAATGGISGIISPLGQLQTIPSKNNAHGLSLPSKKHSSPLQKLIGVIIFWGIITTGIVFAFANK